MELAFYDALGNRYLAAPPGVLLDSAHIRSLCRLRGSDGLLMGRWDASGRILLTIGNADGSFAENSGNGTRIYARFLWDEGQIFVPSCTIVPPAGPIPCTVGSGDEVSALLAPCSAAPALTHLPLPAVSGFRASAGNPHFVIPVKEFPSDWQRIAAAVAGGGAFPRGSNVEFAKMLNSGHIDVRVWERGVGRTKSCGSGAACCAATFFRHFSAAAQLTVSMEGGTLRTEIEGGGVRIGGPVTRIG